MNKPAFIALLSTAAILGFSCVVTDVEDADPGGGSSGGGQGGEQGSPGRGGGGAGDIFGDGGGGRIGNDQGGAGGRSESAASSGVVACGESSCDIPQICCVIDELPECVDAADQCNSAAATTKVVMECDDVADCSDGETCCASMDAGGEVYSCGPTPCELYEVCVKDGTCLTADVSCAASLDSASGHKCEPN